MAPLPPAADAYAQSLIQNDSSSQVCFEGLTDHNLIKLRGIGLKSSGIRSNGSEKSLKLLSHNNLQAPQILLPASGW